jgi:aconitate hydratase
MLALTFVNKDDYELVRQDDIVTIKGFDKMAPGEHLTVKLDHHDGTNDEFPVAHTYNHAQIEWVRFGSALNKISAEANA